MPAETLLIERLDLRGDGIANGIKVARALPGEEVTGEIVDGRIAQPKVLMPSADRVKAPCVHYRSCGGCTLQHASDSFVADWKQDVVRRALNAQNLDAPIRNLHTSPAQSRRRAAFSGRRLKSGALVGFHARASDNLTPITNCQLLDPALLALIPLLENITTVGTSRKAELTLTVTLLDPGADIAVQGGKPLDTDLRLTLARLLEQSSAARLTWDGEAVYQSDPPSLMFGPARVSPPSGAFLQATPQGEAALLASVRDAVGQASRIVDLFAGSGTFSLPLAQTAEVHAVEGLASMLQALDAGWRHANGLKRVKTEARDLFRRPLLPDELNAFDAAVIDPPRAGAEAQAREIARSKLSTVAAVSCNPVTFARDARILCEAGFQIDWIDVVDQFRWSGHIELAGRFSRA